MKHDFYSLAERVLYTLIFLTLLAILAGSLFFLTLGSRQETETEPEQTQRITEKPEETLSGPEYYLPENLAFGEKLPYTQFLDADGRTVDLTKSCAGSRVVLMYWGSWCPYCERQLEHLEEFRRVLETQGNTRLLLVNKTDVQKGETVEKAEAYLKEKGWQDAAHVYDTNLAAYSAYGMKRIPTTIVLDEEGYVRAMAADTLESGEDLSRLLAEAAEGNGPQLLAFLTGHMMNEDGGLYTAYRDSDGAHPRGHDVLSESMGLLMEYAVSSNNRELFDRSWQYVSEQMQRGGVFAWYVDADGQQADSNALLDDLRIAGALCQADKKWGGYAQAVTELAGQLRGKNTYRNQLSSFYDFNQLRSGSSISLAYGDFATLEALAEYDPAFAELGDRLKIIVAGGFISEEFPLYYGSYDYKAHKYSTDSLNTAEALLTVYHLCGTELLRPQTLVWLKNALQTDTLAARYDIHGKPVPGYQYDSTAVYAIAARIGQKCADGELYRLARQKMEKARVTDPDSLFLGAFCHRSDGGDLRSFDQLMPLLVYSEGRYAKFREMK